MRRRLSRDLGLVALSLVAAVSLSALAPERAEAQQVLVYDENSTHGRALDACMRLSLTCTRARAADFATQIPSRAWDLIVVDLPSSEPTGAWQSALATYITGGGRAIHSQWNAGSLGTLPAAYRVTIGASHDAIPFHRWSSSVLFTTPNAVPSSFTTITDLWGTNGFYLDPIAPAYAAAGFTTAPASGQAAIVVGNSDRTIFNGFLFDDFTGDDGDGVPDITELLMNEITFLLGGASPTAPCVGLAEGASCTTSSGATGTCRSGGCCTGCWDGARCQIGTSATSCGVRGASCASCSDGMPCTSDVCTAGVCAHPAAPAGTPCDDGLFCTRTDACDGGATCVGSGARCDDGEDCTTDSCDEASDACTNAPRADLGACLAGAASGLCRAGACCAGCWTGSACATGTTAATCGRGGGACTSCVDGDSCTTDVCSAGACSNPRAPVGTTCDDGMYCTPIDRCDASGACVGSGVRCNDGMSCTIDTCDEVADTCVYTAGMGCTIGGECVGAGTVHPASPCLECDPSRSTTDWSPRAAGTLCGADRCTGGRFFPASTCDAAGVCVAGTSTRCATGACADATRCEPSCADTGCPAGEWCATSGACEAQLGDGATCISDAACTSGECTDGVCCDVACDGTCERCDDPSAVGTCTRVAAGEDPDRECDLACDGAGACETAGDAGAPPGDAGAPRDAGTSSGGDSGTSGGADAGGGAAPRSSGCSCRAIGGGDASGGAGAALGALAIAVALARRRRRAP